MLPIVATVVLCLAPAVQAEAPARRVELEAVRGRALSHISAVAELPDGRIVVSDARAPAVWLIDPSTGERAALGSPGAGQGQYVQPGGLYAGPGDSLLLLDRAQGQAMVISPAARFERVYSIAVPGLHMASDADADLQRLDSLGHAYFQNTTAGLRRQMRGESAGTVPLVRFDPASVESQLVTELALPASRAIDAGGGVLMTQSIFGSPADGWGVAPDGRVAVVRGAPYRVDWILPDGTVQRGPPMSYEPLPMTAADRDAYARATGGLPSVGVTSASGTRAVGPAPLFAETKAAFSPEDVLVSPDGLVWVRRSALATAPDVTYDVFDSHGARIDRVSYEAAGPIVGFGARHAYVRSVQPDDSFVLVRFPRPTR